MTERSLTPSPLRSQNLERGVFSSLSALSLYKQSAEEKKQVQSTSTIANKKIPPKPRSPNRVRSATKRTEKSPEQPRSPLKVTNRGREEQDIRAEQEYIKLQDTVKSLKILVEKERKIHLKLEAENKELKTQVKSEQEKNEKLQKNIQSLMNNSNLAAQENSRLAEEIKEVKSKQEGVKECLKSISAVFVSVLGSFFAGFEEVDGLVGQEKSRVLAKIKEMVAWKLEEVQSTTEVDLTRQQNEIRGWLLVKNFPRQQKNKKDDSEMKYTVEYFNEAANFSEKVQSKLNKGRDEVSFKKNAVALYDFEGEREDDLSFFCGDTIEIIEETESGWWIGKLNGKTGSFPYNFVQVV